MGTDDRVSRRRVLGTFANGFGVLGLAALLADEARADAAAAAADPLAVKPPMFPARARRVIFLFMSGGRRTSTRSTPSPGWPATTASRSPSPCPTWCGRRPATS